MQPSLSPVFAALSRHLLALKWQDDMAAEEVAEAEEQEARRQALLEELLNEDDSSQVGAGCVVRNCGSDAGAGCVGSRAHDEVQSAGTFDSSRGPLRSCPNLRA